MWNLLKQADLEKARQEVDRRQAEMLRRHAQELEELESSETEIENLRAMVIAFAQKFKKPNGASPLRRSVPTMMPEPAVASTEQSAVAPSELEPVAPIPEPELEAEAAVPEPLIASEKAEPEMPAEQAIEPDMPAAAVAAAPPKPTLPPKQNPPPSPRDYAGTNFEVFSRAMSKSTF